MVPIAHPNAIRSRRLPAGAGMVPSASSPPAEPSGLSRMRGDGPVIRQLRVTVSAAPPQARGWSHIRYKSAGWYHGSPAHAGSKRGLKAAGGDQAQRLA